jgi:SAM-dependent methyltransferase
MAQRDAWTRASRDTRRFDDTRRDWTTLGARDALWAVLALPGKKDGAWDVGEFLATGQADVDATVAWLDELGLPTRWERVLDFGCGVGRISQALARHANEVIGVDISPPMLEVARAIDRTNGACRFVINDVTNLSQFPDGHFDLVFCVLVLQHLPRPVVHSYLAEFLRVLRPGGTVVVQVPTRPLWRVKGVIWRIAPFPLVGWAQRRLLGYPAPMRMTRFSDAAVRAAAARHSAKVAGRLADPTYTEHFQNTRYALVHDN